ncbi:unnamed protein product, partial [Trichobilharzia regenti]
AFSHFTFERSGHRLIVVDIQGVGNLWTDPQIHTFDGKSYGDGNLGIRGMALFFHTHRCNPLCVALALSPFDLPDNEKYSKPFSQTVTEADNQNDENTQSCNDDCVSVSCLLCAYYYISKECSLHYCIHYFCLIFFSFESFSVSIIFS